MRKTDRPRFGDPEYTLDDAYADVDALERAVMRGADAVERFYRRRGGCEYTARALAIACRYTDLETVEALIRHGASFTTNKSELGTYYPHEPYEYMILPDYPPLVRRSKGRRIPRKELLEIVRLLYRHAGGDFSGVLFRAIINGDDDIAEELIRLGAKLSPIHHAIVTGEREPNSWTPDRSVLHDTIEAVSDARLKRMITLFRKCPDVDLFAVSRADVLHTSTHYPKAEKELQDRFRRPDLLAFMLQNTTISKVVTRRMLIDAVIEHNNVEGLEWLISKKMLNRRADIEYLMQTLGKAPDKHPEMMAIAVAHNAVHPPKDTSLLIPSDSFAASLMRKIWKYESCGEDGKEVRILRYKADAHNVAVPPRIGRRPVTELGPDVFSADGKLAHYDSITFPGSLKSLTPCFGPPKQHANTNVVVLQDGLCELAASAMRGLEIKEVDIPESVERIGKYALAECSKLVEVHLPSALREIPERMLSDCLRLRKLSDCSKIEVIGPHAFSGTGLKSIDISGALQIGTGAFAKCTKLHKIHLPAQLAVIPPRMFAGCAALEKLPQCTALTGIGHHAFSKSGIREVYLDENVTAIGRHAFEDCKNLASVQINGPVETISKGAFSQCTDLRSVSLPSSIRKIEEEAFKGCVSLTEIEWPERMHKIGEGAFAQSGLVAVHIPKNVEAENGAFKGCAKLTEVSISKDASVGQSVFADCAELHTAAVETGVEGIPFETFKGCRALRNVSLPDTLKTIGRYAFSSAGLKSIEFPRELRRIKLRAFSESALETLTIPAGIRVDAEAFADCRALRCAFVPAQADIAEGAFSQCSRLNSLVLEHGIERVPTRLCEECRSLTRMDIPDSVTEIGYGAFCKTGLKELNIPPSVTKIEGFAFYGTQLERVVIPESVKEIGEAAFAECTKLREVVLPSGLKYLASDLFWHCLSLQRIELPEAVCEMGEWVFAESGIEQICIPNGFKYIPAGAFNECKRLKQVMLPAGIEHIGVGAFAKCKALKAISLPDTLKGIETNAFRYSGVKALSFPASIEWIGEEAFKGCRDLKSVKFEGKKPNIMRSAFSVTPVSHLNPRVRREKSMYWI